MVSGYLLISEALSVLLDAAGAVKSSCFSQLSGSEEIMNPFVSHRHSKRSTSGCIDPTAMAERELSAFFSAVTQLFGKEQAELSAEDWLRELTRFDGLPSSKRDWRLITTKASTLLGIRLTAPSLSSRFTNA
jgi:hypothetical protein